MIKRDEGMVPGPTQQQDWNEQSIGLAARMVARRFPGMEPLIVEIQDGKLCVYPTLHKPEYYSLEQAKKILPKLIEFILGEDK